MRKKTKAIAYEEESVNLKIISGPLMISGAKIPTLDRLTSDFSLTGNKK